MNRKPYRVGVIGSTGRGNYGHGLDTTWLNSDRAQIVAVADDHAQGLAKAQQRLSCSQGYADYRQMLEREELDIVAICQRWIDRHHEMALACAEHGCHIYMEKPFVRDLVEADEVVQALEMRHLKLGIAHTTRYSSHARLARRLITDGTLGEILEIRSRGKEDRRGGGEDLWVLGSHLLDLMRLLVGDATRCMATVREGNEPVVARHVQPGNEGIGPLAGDHIEARFSFRNGAHADFSSRRNRGGRPSRFGLTVYGTKGAMELLTGHRSHVMLLRDPSWSPGRSGHNWEAAEATPASAAESSADPNLAAIEDLMDSIEQDRQPRSSAYDARAAVEMIAAVFESHRAGRPVAFPLENRENPLKLLKSTGSGSR